MKISKLLNKSYLSILIFFLLVFLSKLNAEDEPVDIWDLEKEVEQNSSIITENEDSNENKTESLKSKEPLVEAPKNKNEPLKNKKLKKKKSLVEVPISELKNYIKSYAVIKLKSGKEFKGLIIKSEKNKIQLKIKKSGGYMELPINLEKIDKVVIYK